jgi:hypothetical protein
VNRRLVLSLAAALFSLVLALLLAEGGARLLEKLQPAARPAVKQSGDFIAYDEILGWKLVPGAHGRLESAEFDVSFAINAHGARMSRDVDYARAPELRRVLVLGDSFTFGFGVPDAARFGDAFEAASHGIEVVNLGVIATGTDQQLLLWQREGVKYAPDVVVLGFMTDHIARNARTQLVAGGDRLVAKPRFRLTDGALELENVPVPRAADESPALRFSALARLVARARSARGEGLAASATDPYPQYREGAPEWQLTRALILELARSVRATGSEFLVLSIPAREYALDAALEPVPSRMIAELCASSGIDLLDPLDELRALVREGKQPYFAKDPHWTAAGHSLAADLLSARLTGRLATSAGISTRFATRISDRPRVSKRPRLAIPG